MLESPYGRRHGAATREGAQHDMTRAAIYLRISDDKTGEGLGVERQREDCTALCERNGWTPVEYQDNDISASSFTRKRRPDYERMLADIREGAIGAVVVYKADRLHRRPVELESFIKLADEKGIPLATVTGRLDLSTAEGRMMARNLGNYAAYESEVKGERQRRAALQKAERGLPSWREAFGYMSTPEGPMPDPQTAPVVKRMYAVILAGGSLGDVAKMLRQAGHPVGLTGRPWTASTISLFLRAARNAGLRSHNDVIVGKATWPGMVDEQTWRTVQAILGQPSRRPGKKTVQRHRLTSMMACGKCGTKLGAHQIISTKAIAYVCKNGACRGTSIRAEHIDPFLLDVVAGRLAMPDAVELLKADEHNAEAAEGIRAALAELAARRENIGVAVGTGLMSPEQAGTANAIINAEVAKLEARQQDSNMARILDGLPLGRPEVVEAVNALSDDRFRAVLDVLAAVTIEPIGKGGKTFKPERIKVTWK